MLKYKFNGVIYNKLPDPLNTGEFMISPMTPEKFIDLGGEIYDDGIMSDFQICCEKFRSIVFDIADFIHDPTFRGGLNEIHKLNDSPYSKADPTTANTLYNRWTGANLACLYEGGRIGLGQPAWFKKCWKDYEEEQAAKAAVQTAQQTFVYDPYANPYEESSYVEENPYDA